MLVWQGEIQVNSGSGASLVPPPELAPGRYRAVVVWERISEKESWDSDAGSGGANPQATVSNSIKILPEDLPFLKSEMNKMSAEGLDPWAESGL